MASSFHYFLLFIINSFLFLNSCIAKTTTQRLNALVLPITKLTSTNDIQYITQIHQRTPLVPVKLALYLGGDSLVVDCEDLGFVSSTYKPALCGSAECTFADARCNDGMCSGIERPGCHNNTCLLQGSNPFTSLGSVDEVGSDVVSVQSTDGSSPRKSVSVANFVFVCSSSTIKLGLGKGVKGIAGLGRYPISLPFQLASAHKLSAKFAICLPSSTSESKKGTLFVGEGPYVYRPNIDVSKSLIHTKLYQMPRLFLGTFRSSPESFTEYFVKVKSIKVNGIAVPLNTSLLPVKRSLNLGGTKISTTVPYTKLETSIFKAVVNAFVKAMGNIPRVKPVEPFEACFSSKNIGSTPFGPAVPKIDLMFEKRSVSWSMFGANSMVRVSDKVMCLGFVDGFDIESMRSAIIIGAHQLEDNLLEFDVANSRLGFSSSLRFGSKTTCSNFDFQI
uniref:Peptidase A1 domain-containing protein n=1 Tax=Cannabis sativa TaxID=3483 RepID=A0A803R8L8_CANSA